MNTVDLWYATRATGIMALVLLTATMVLGIVVAGRAPGRLAAFARARIHARLSALTVTFVAVHVLTSVLDPYVTVGWWSLVLPFGSHYRPGWTALGTVGADLLLAVAISSAARRFVPARAWRALHWLAYLSWPTAVSHALGMGTDARFRWLQALVSACTAAVVVAAGWRALEAARARRGRPATFIEPRPSLRPGPNTEAA